MMPGSKLAALVAGCVLIFAAAAKPQVSRHAPYAVMAGTVFRENGFSLSGAKVTLGVKDAPRIKKLQALSDARGEFAFRVRPEAASYLVQASMKGYEAVEKEAFIAGEERVDVTLVLPTESK